MAWSEEQVMEVPFHHPGSLWFQDEEVFVSYKQGMIRGYDQHGNIFFATGYTQETEPAAVFRHEDLLIADLKEKSGHRRFITTYYAVSGMQKYQYESNLEVVGFFALNQDRVYVVANGGRTSNIYTYDTEDDQLVLLHDFPWGEIHSATAIDDKNLMIGCEEGAFWYRYEQNSLTQFVDHIAARKLSYEELGSYILLSDEHNFHLYSYPDGIPKGDITFDDRILNVHTLYNK